VDETWFNMFKEVCERTKAMQARASFFKFRALSERIQNVLWKHFWLAFVTCNWLLSVVSTCCSCQLSVSVNPKQSQMSVTSKKYGLLSVVSKPL